MIAITRSKYGVPIRDVFFADRVDPGRTRVPLCVFQQTAHQHHLLKPVQAWGHQAPHPPHRGDRRPHLKNHYKIRRAEREGLAPRLMLAPTDEDARRFADYYDTFARHKGLPPGNRTKLAALGRRSALLLSSVTDSEGTVLSAHAHVKDAGLGRVRLLYSASHFRAMSDSGERNRVGRANRLLHWHEITTRSSVSGTRSTTSAASPSTRRIEEKNDIARFKLEFGGDLFIEYSGVLPMNVLGRVLLPLARKRLG